MEDEFSCSICLEIADNAVETSCCHHIFCEQCLSRMLGKECPQCRGIFKVIISHIARRVIGNMPTTCDYIKCKIPLTRSTVKDHERACKYRIFICPSEACDFEGERPAYLEHLFKEHDNIIVENARFCFNMEGATTTSQQQTDVIAIMRNSAGRDSRLGETGKYYCTGRLGKYDCSCCDGSCGPSNGCNCQPCMKLDIASRKLPSKFFVNREGAICRKSTKAGIFYCGRMVMNRSRDCDGYCGPSDGPHCRACEIMQYQHDTRYSGIW